MSTFTLGSDICSTFSSGSVSLFVSLHIASSDSLSHLCMSNSMLSGSEPPRSITFSSDEPMVSCPVLLVPIIPIFFERHFIIKLSSVSEPVNSHFSSSSYFNGIISTSAPFDRHVLGSNCRSCKVDQFTKCCFTPTIA